MEPPHCGEGWNGEEGWRLSLCGTADLRPLCPHIWCVLSCLVLLMHVHSTFLLLCAHSLGHIWIAQEFGAASKHAHVCKYLRLELSRGLGAPTGHWVKGNENENLLLSSPTCQLSTKMMTCGGKRRIARWTREHPAEVDSQINHEWVFSVSILQQTYLY